MAFVAVRDALLGEDGEAGVVSVEHFLGDFPDEALLGSDVGAGHINRKADAESGGGAVVGTVPGVAVPADERTGGAFSRDNFIVAAFPNDHLASFGTAAQFVASGHECSGTVFFGEVCEHIGAVADQRMRREW